MTKISVTAIYRIDWEIHLFKKKFPITVSQFVTQCDISINIYLIKVNNIEARLASMNAALVSLVLTLKRHLNTA